MKHTKGTWEPERTGSTNESDMNSGRNTHKFIIKSDEPMNRRYGNKIANILGNESDAKANAHLIANAPEMLDALKMVKDAWENNEVNFECNESNGTGYVGTHHLIKKALDAIAKAEGSAS